MGKSDDLFYARLERKQEKQRARLKRRDENRAKTMPLIQAVRDGDITLEEAQDSGHKGRG